MDINRKSAHYLSAAVLFSGIAILFFRNIPDGLIGLRQDWIIPPYNQQVLTWSKELFFSWIPQGLGHRSLYPTEFIFRLQIAFFSFLSGELLAKGILIFLLSLSGLSVYYLCRILKINPFFSVISGVFYMASPVTFNRIVAGHLNYLESFAIAPLILALFIKIVDEPESRINIKYAIICGILYAISWVQIQFALMVLFLLILYVLINKISKRNIFYLLLITTISILVHLPWILPLVLYPAGMSDFLEKSATVDLIQHQSESATLINSLRLVGYVNRYYLDSVPENDRLIWGITGVAIAAIVYLSLLTRPKDKKIFFFASAAIISMVLAAGTNPPLGGILVFLYGKFSILNTFREIYHIMFIPALSYSVLIGFSLNDIISNRPSVKYDYLIKSVLIVVVAVAFYHYTLPFLSGNFGGNVQTYSLSPEYYDAYNRISGEEGDFRVLWLPSIQPVRFDSLKYSGIDPLIQYSPKRSTFTQWIFSPLNSEGKLATFTLTSMLGYDKNDITPILNVTNTRYVVYRDNFVSEYPNFSLISSYPQISNLWTNNRLKENLDHQSKLTRVTGSNNITIYENRDFLPHVYAAPAAAIAISDLSPLVDPDFKYDKMLIFSSQLKKNQKIPDSVDQITFYNARCEEEKPGECSFINNYSLSLISPEYRIYPGDHTKNTDAARGWTSIFNIWWYGDYSSLLGNPAVTFVKSNLTLPYNPVSSGYYSIYLKTCKYGKRSQIKIYMDKHKIGEVDDLKNTNNWISSGTFYLTGSEHEVIIESEGENCIEELVIIPQVTFEKTREALMASLNKKKIQIINKPGAGPVKHLYNIVEIPEDGNYTLSLYAKGHKEAANRSKYLFIKFDKYSFNTSLNSSFNRATTKEFELKRGKIDVHFETNGEFELEEFIIESKDKTNKNLPEPEISFVKINPGLLNVKISAKKPYFLVFSETYDNHWKAIVDGAEEVQEAYHFEANGFANAWYIDRTGNYTVTLKYKPQDAFDIGLKISFIVLIILSILLFIPSDTYAKYSKRWR